MAYYATIHVKFTNCETSQKLNICIVYLSTTLSVTYINSKARQKMTNNHEPWYLVIGACGGIGQEVVKRLTEVAHKVVGVDVTEKSSANSWQYIIAKIPESGFGWLDILIKTHGAPCGVVFAQGVYKRIHLEEYNQNNFDEILSSNYSAVFWSLQMIIPRMVIGGGGNVVVISSQAGATGGADPVYASAKAACNALVKSIAREYGKSNISINVVSPGPVNTNMAFSAMSTDLITRYKNSIPIGRFSEAVEVADIVNYLLVSSKGAINGTTIDIDGGLVRR